MLKTRVLPECNYKAIFHNGKTIRLSLDKSKPVKELTYPEFYDIKITNKCSGECPYCYQESFKEDRHYENILEKTNLFFEPMTTTKRPFQVALGGGEPTSHPDFLKLLKLFNKLDIIPNYTTNGMIVTDEQKCSKLIQATKKYCGGVAVSAHPHLDKYWTAMIHLLAKENIKTNLHVIISDKKSIDRFMTIFNLFKNKVRYFVLLPLENTGRATTMNEDKDFDYLFRRLKTLKEVAQISYGANFYEELKKYDWLDVSLYEPEMFSKYLDLKDMSLYKSSFNLEKVATI